MFRDCALTSFGDPGKVNENNLSNEEHLFLKDLFEKFKHYYPQG